MYPESLNNAINSFKRLPGIGEKSAERFALSILDLDEEEIEKFSKSIKTCKEQLHRCKTCGHLTDKDECSICTDKSRKDNVICVVEDYKSVFMFEKSGSFQGKYHVLNGLISPMEGILPEDVNISSLITRIEGKEDVEIILALKPTIEGETTTMYIKKILDGKGVKVSRLSYGIPMGVDIDYLDSITLDRALLDRIEL